MLFACGSSPTFGFELKEKWALEGLGQTVDVPGLKVLTGLWGEAEEGFTASSQRSHRDKSLATVFAEEYSKGDTRIRGEEEHNPAQIRSVTESL